ncbi:putative reverse transcriptase domain-containing protein [Tanacetum coccineum]
MDDTRRTLDFSWVHQGFRLLVWQIFGESNIENISVVRGFADVFPDELPGLPPAREIEFGIELIPGAEPISKAPYRMTPVDFERSLRSSYRRCWRMALIGGQRIIMDPSRLKYHHNGRDYYGMDSVWMLSYRVRGSGGLLAACMRIESNLMLRSKSSKDDGEVVCLLSRNVETALREKVMTEAHSSPFTIHPGSTKMYRDLKQYFWWNGMKQDVATFVSKCMTCQQVKIEHQRASGVLSKPSSAQFLTHSEDHGISYVGGEFPDRKSFDCMYQISSSIRHESVREDHSDFGQDMLSLCFGYGTGPGALSRLLLEKVAVDM